VNSNFPLAIAERFDPARIDKENTVLYTQSNWKKEVELCITPIQTCLYYSPILYIAVTDVKGSVVLPEAFNLVLGR
jgi:hypothetical protein